MVGLSSRERVRKVLNKKIPDKVPIDFGGMRSTGIHVVAYNKLKSYLEIDTPTKIYDLHQQLAKPEEKILDKFEADIIQLHRFAPEFGVEIDNWKEWTHPDGFNCLVPEGFSPQKNKRGDLEIWEKSNLVAKMPSNGYYFDIVYHPLAEAKNISGIKNHEFPYIEEKELSWLEKKLKTYMKKLI